MLPNLIIIGASRCGTTSLHRYLDLHPQISMSQTKEPDFFVEDRNWRRGRGWYERQFSGTSPVRGEASTRYTAYPYYDGVPERIAGLIPMAKLVYLVRDPIDRAVSAYSLSQAMGGDKRPIEQAFREDTSEGFYLEQGRYWMQLERYLEHFPASQITVVDQHELMYQRRVVLARLFRFLDVDVSFDSPELDDKHNPTPSTRRNRLGSAVVRVLDSVVGERRAVRLRSASPKMLRRPFVGDVAESKPVLDDALRERLIVYFADDVRQLRAFSHSEFASWSI